MILALCLFILKLSGAVVIAIVITACLRVSVDMFLNGKDRIREHERWRHEHRNDINGMYVNKEGKLVLIKRFDDDK